jgi:N-acetyl-anhydromuramyl-L-alanine amidase AmpD
VHGEELAQYDFTPEQYASLEALTAALVRLFPRIALDAPRASGGAVRGDTLTSEELARFRGILGHFHIGAHKVDPGPAFDWERFLAGVRVRLAAP